MSLEQRVLHANKFSSKTYKLQTLRVQERTSSNTETYIFMLLWKHNILQLKKKITDIVHFFQCKKTYMHKFQKTIEPNESYIV